MIGDQSCFADIAPWNLGLLHVLCPTLLTPPPTLSHCPSPELLSAFLAAADILLADLLAHSTSSNHASPGSDTEPLPALGLAGLSAQRGGAGAGRSAVGMWFAAAFGDAGGVAHALKLGVSALSMSPVDPHGWWLRCASSARQAEEVVARRAASRRAKRAAGGAGGGAHARQGSLEKGQGGGGVGKRVVRKLWQQQVGGRGVPGMREKGMAWVSSLHLALRWRNFDAGGWVGVFLVVTFRGLY